MDSTQIIDPFLRPDAAEELRKRVALFRYGVIADLVHLPSGQRGLYKLLAEKAEREHEIPGSLRRHVAVETMRGWLAEVRSGARARPVEANLTRGAEGYSGTIVVALPGTP